jgi:uncharacterized protein (DUF2249 family)
MTSTLATATATAATLDLRAIAAHERHARVFSQFDALQVGQSLQLQSDHDPQPLRGQFDKRCRGQFAWAALEAGPAVWRVQLTRIGAKPAPWTGDSCCSGGACGG